MQNAQIQIILRMRNVSSGPLLSIPTFCSIQLILLADNEGPDQTARMRRLILAFTARIRPEACFRMVRPICQYLRYFWQHR